jgi:hypothetical protein
MIERCLHFRSQEPVRWLDIMFPIKIRSNVRKSQTVGQLQEPLELLISGPRKRVSGSDMGTELEGYYIRKVKNCKKVCPWMDRVR